MVGYAIEIESTLRSWFLVGEYGLVDPWSDDGVYISKLGSLPMAANERGLTLDPHILPTDVALLRSLFS